MPQDDGRMAASSSDASSVYPPPRFDEHAGDRLILPQQQQQQQQRSRPIAIIRRKSSDFHHDDDDDDSSDDTEQPDQTTRTSRMTTTTTFQTHRPHHQSMPTNPALLLRAPLLSSIPTRYDQEDLIPAFRLSEEPDQDDDRPLGPFTTSTSTQPQAYGSLRESQMQQQQQFLRAGSAGKPHSFIRKRGGVGPLQHIITDSDHNNNNNNAMMTASSAPIRSTLRTNTTTNTTTATSTTTSGLTIGERIQQQRKLQLALLSNQNNSTNNNNNETGEMELTGDHISNSGVSTTQPKRNSSILAAMLLDQPAPPPSPPPNNFTEDDRPFWSTQQQQQNPHTRLDTTGSSNTSTQPLSTSFTGLEILQQQGRRPWSQHHHHQSSVLPTVPQISRSHSQPGFMTSASDLDHRHGAVDPVHFSLPPTAPYFATTTSTTALAHFTATSWHDRPHRAVATGLEQITTNNNNNNDDDDDFMDENGDNEEDDDDIVETFDLDME